MDTQQKTEAGGAGSNRTPKALVAILVAIVLVLVLTWAVSVFFEIAILKSLAGVILVLFLAAIALMVVGIG